MNRLKFSFVIALLLWLSFEAANAQSSGQSSPNAQVPTITTRSNLVLVPVLVKSKAAKVVFSLTAEDFILTDNGVRAQGSPDMLEVWNAKGATVAAK